MVAGGRLAGAGRVVAGMALCFHTDSLGWSVGFSMEMDIDVDVDDDDCCACGEIGRVGS